jgi:hypothetical protein
MKKEAEKRKYFFQLLLNFLQPARYEAGLGMMSTWQIAVVADCYYNLLYGE